MRGGDARVFQARDRLFSRERRENPHKGRFQEIAVVGASGIALEARIGGEIRSPKHRLGEQNPFAVVLQP
jgi:hypothetical protein